MSDFKKKSLFGCLFFMHITSELRRVANLKKNTVSEFVDTDNSKIFLMLIDYF
jgi:hypothetical protein